MPLLEFHALNPFTFAPSLGLSLYMILIHIPIVGGFAFAALYIIKYLKKFYGPRPIPLEWKIFWTALIWATIHELIEVPLLYQWVVGQILLIIYFFVQIIAGIYLVWGAYLLAKKYILR